MKKIVEALLESIQFGPQRIVLWPDKERQWETAIPILRKKIPGLLSLGAYDPDAKAGPAIWLRCAIARTIKQFDFPEKAVFVLYLPGFGMEDLKAVQSSPKELRPLVELQYRASIWSQYNGKDWTILSYLVSDRGGLGLDVAKDAETKIAMQNALLPLLQEDVDELKGKRLDKEYFNLLLTGGDPFRDMLNWLNLGDEFKQSLSHEQWQAFKSTSKDRFGINPDKDGFLSAAEKLAEHKKTRSKIWEQTWDRFCDTPKKYPNIPDLIRKLSVPEEWMYLQNADGFFNCYPQWNDEMEQNLIQALQRLPEMNVKDAREKITELEADHARRRELIWAELGEAKYAELLSFLSLIAKFTSEGLDHFDLPELEKRYSEHLWKVDGAVVQLLSRIDSADDLQLFGSILDLLYLPWLDASACQLRKTGLFARYDNFGNSVDLESVDAVLFVDGLRFDCAKRLAEILNSAGFETEESMRWTGLPTITATCKPMLIESLCKADTVMQDEDTSNYEVINRHHFKRTMEKDGWQVVTANEQISSASNLDGTMSPKLWVEYGNLDELGHSQKRKLAKHIENTLEEIAGRIREMAEAGWEKILILSDHGWLLSPLGLPKTELPSCLSENKWSRFASLKEGAQTQEYLVPWYWDSSKQIAVANGVSCYRENVEYAHGGLSIQECLLLDIRVSKGKTGSTSTPIKITDIKWTQMRCHIAVDGRADGMVFDIRTEPGNALSSVVLDPKPIKQDRSTSVVVEDEALQGSTAYITILDADKNVVSQIQTIIGGGSNDSTG